jgi:peptidoglycan/xylan/chitin deacetylase (PgdA/CDA1 family)
MIIFLTIAVVLLAVLFASWRFRFRYPPDDAPRVLCYHKISDRFCFEGTWMTRRRFLRQIDHVSSRGFDFIDEADYLATLDGNPPAGNSKTEAAATEAAATEASADQPSASEPPGNRVLLTFDDGYAELAGMYEEELLPRAVPLLVFLITEFVGADNTWDIGLGRRSFKHLTWDDVRALASKGVSFGSHGATHRDLTRLRPDELALEIEGSRRRIHEETGIAPRCFSYPFGRANDTVKRAVRDAGYEAAFSLYPPHANDTVDRFALRRNGVYIIDTDFALDCKMTRGPLFWFEEMKCRTINAVAVLTPLIKRVSSGRGR